MRTDWLNRCWWTGHDRRPPAPPGAIVYFDGLPENGRIIARMRRRFGLPVRRPTVR